MRLPIDIRFQASGQWEEQMGRGIVKEIETG
jgi:hypothetical protein